MRCLAGVLLGLIALTPVGADQVRRVAVQPGKLVARVACAGFSGQTYAVYVPSRYTPDREWPVVYCFDPMGDARRAIERFVPGAERLGYVVAASYNARNADPEGAGLAAEAMLQDTHRVLRLDPQRHYAAGFSGGAVVATAVATALQFRGVIAVGGPLNDDSVRAGTFALFGAAGEEDFNFQVMRGIDRAWSDPLRPHRFLTFPGRHEWLPASLATEALEWFALLALKDGLPPEDVAEVEAWYSRRLERAATASEPVVRHAAYGAIVEDFTGLRDVSEAQKQAAALASHRAVRDAAAQERRAEQTENVWLERLNRASAIARFDLPVAAPAWTDHALTREGLSAEPDAMGRGWSGPGLPTGDANLAAGVTVDGWDALRTTAERAARAARRDVSVRRALNGVFVGHLEAAQQSLGEEDFGQAVRFLRVATALYPQSPDAWLLLARTYAMQGRVREGRAALEEANALGGLDAELVAAIEHALAHPEEAVIALQPYIVKERGALTTSFGLALTILAEPKTGRIKQVIVKGVAERSEAEAAGIRPGDELLEADGIALNTLVARFDRGGQFHRLFMRRDPGATIRVRVVSGGAGDEKTVALTQRRSLPLLDPFEARLR